MVKKHYHRHSVNACCNANQILGRLVANKRIEKKPPNGGFV